MFMGAPQTGPSKWPATLSLLWPTLMTVAGTRPPALPGSARGAGGGFRALPPCGSREDSFSEILGGEDLKWHLDVRFSEGREKKIEDTDGEGLGRRRRSGNRPF